MQKPELLHGKHRIFRAGETPPFRDFDGATGQVGTRNYWLVVPLVFCENQNLQSLQRAFEKVVGDSQPEGYQRHVADLVDLYRSGRIEEISRYTFPDYAADGGRAKCFRIWMACDF